MRRRELRILQLVEWAELEGLRPSRRAYETIRREARKWFLVREETAGDYAQLVMWILSDPIRMALELSRLRRGAAVPDAPRQCFTLARE